MIVNETKNIDDIQSQKIIKKQGNEMQKRNWSKKKKNTFWTLNQIINNPESYRLSMNWKTQLFGLFTKKSSIKHVNLAKENQTNKKGF